MKFQIAIKTSKSSPCNDLLSLDQVSNEAQTWISHVIKTDNNRCSEAHFLNTKCLTWTFDFSKPSQRCHSSRVKICFEWTWARGDTCFTASKPADKLVHNECVRFPYAFESTVRVFAMHLHWHGLKKNKLLFSCCVISWKNRHQTTAVLQRLSAVRLKYTNLKTCHWNHNPLPDSSTASVTNECSERAPKCFILLTNINYRKKEKKWVVLSFYITLTFYILNKFVTAETQKLHNNQLWEILQSDMKLNRNQKAIGSHWLYRR